MLRTMMHGTLIAGVILAPALSHICGHCWDLRAAVAITEQPPATSTHCAGKSGTTSEEKKQRQDESGFSSGCNGACCAKVSATAMLSMRALASLTDIASFYAVTNSYDSVMGMHTAFSRPIPRAPPYAIPSMRDRLSLKQSFII